MADNKYTLYWKTGDREVVEGPTPAKAMTLAGYSGGAVAALDFYVNGDAHGYRWNKVRRYWDAIKQEGENASGSTAKQGQ